MTRTKRAIAVFCAVILLLSSGAMPISAQAVTMKQANKLNKSDKITLAESWYFGLYEYSWLQQWKGSLTKKQTQQLGSQLAKLISDDFGLKKDKSFKKVKYNKSMKRKDVISVLYNAVGKYKLPGKLNKAKTGSVSYFVKRGILTNTKKKQYLDKKCTAEQAIVWASNLYYDILDTKKEGSKGFFWKATKGTNTVYLMGSIHVGISSMYPVNKKVRNAIRQADSLFVECNSGTDEGQDAYLAKTTYTDGTTIKNHISAKSYEELTKVCQKYGLNQQVVDTLKPWYVANTISSFYEYDTNSYSDIAYYSLMGIDNYFMDIAEQAEIPIGELETVSGQLDIFDTMSDSEQQEYLDFYMDKVLYSSQEERDALMYVKMDMWRCWAKGDYQAFKERYTDNSDISDNSDSSLSDKLTGERDTAMADKIAEMLDADDGKTYFIVIGSAHVETDGLVVDQLKAKGYNISRVQ